MDLLQLRRRRGFRAEAPPTVWSRAEAYWDAREYNPDAEVLMDLMRNGHNAQLGSDPVAYIGYDYDGSKALRLPGESGNYGSTPDAAVLDIVGDIDLRAQMDLPDWTPAARGVVIGRWISDATHRLYQLRLNTSGTLSFVWSSDGGAGGHIGVESTASVPGTPGTKLWIRATLDVDNGAGGYDAKFWTSADGSSWTQLGATVVGGATTNLTAGTLQLLVGALSSSTEMVIGSIHRCQIYDGIDGTLVFDADFTLQPVGTTSFAESANGAIVTVNRDGADANDPSFFPHPSKGLDPLDNYLELPGTNGNVPDTPTSAALAIAGDIDLRARLACDWTPPALMFPLARWATSACYGLALEDDGKLSLWWTLAGGASIFEVSTAAVGFTDGTAHWIRATLDVDDGAGGSVVKFYTSDDGVAWTQLGTTITRGGTTSINAAATALELGAISSVTLKYTGDIYRAQVYDGIDGTLVFDYDPSKSFTVDQSVNAAPITTNRSATGAKSAEVTRPVFLPHTDDFFEIAAHPNLEFAAADVDFTLVALFRQHGTPNSYSSLLHHVGSSGGSSGWSLRMHTTLREAGFYIADGAGTTDRSNSIVADGAMFTMVGRRTSAGPEAIGNNLSDGPTAPNRGNLTNSSLPIRMCSNAYNVGAVLDGEWFASLIFREALTDDDLLTLEAELGL